MNLAKDLNPESLPCSANLRSGGSWCGRCERTSDLPSDACLQLGSPFAPPLVTLTAARATSICVGWLNVSAPSDVAPPGDAGPALRIENAECQPIFGLLPATGQPRGILTARSSHEDDFEVFFFTWSHQCGYAFLNSGVRWRKDTGILTVSPTPARLRLRLLRCREIPAREAREALAPWVASFRVERRSLAGQSEDASPQEETWLQQWLNGPLTQPL